MPAVPAPQNCGCRVDGGADTSPLRSALPYVAVLAERDRSEGDRHADALDEREPLVVERDAERDRDDRIERGDQRRGDRREPLHAAEPTRVGERGPDQTEVEIAARVGERHVRQRPFERRERQQHDAAQAQLPTGEHDRLDRRRPPLLEQDGRDGHDRGRRQRRTDAERIDAAHARTEQERETDEDRAGRADGLRRRTRTQHPPRQTDHEDGCGRAEHRGHAARQMVRGEEHEREERAEVESG